MPFKIPSYRAPCAHRLPAAMLQGRINDCGQAAAAWLLPALSIAAACFYPDILCPLVAQISARFGQEVRSGRRAQ